MQTTKFLFAIGTAALLAVPPGAIAGPDNEAQAKMREALRQKMAELNAPAAPAPAPAPVAPKPAAAPAPAPAPASPPPPAAKTQTVVVPVPAEPAASSATDEATAARMREALRQEMEKQNAPAAVVPTVVAAPVVSQAAPGDAKFSEVVVTTDEEKAAQMREALRQKMALPAQPAAPIVAAPAKPTKAAAVVAPAPAANLPAPASPLTGSKQERLAELLSRYKADAITPQDYHTQRAKIIAEP